MSKKVCSLESKLWSDICSQNSFSSNFVTESPVKFLLLASASNSSPANSFDSFIPASHHEKNNSSGIPNSLHNSAESTRASQT